MLAYLIIKQAKFQYFFPFVTPYYKCYITQNPSQLGITIESKFCTGFFSP